MRIRIPRWSHCFALSFALALLILLPKAAHAQDLHDDQGFCMGMHFTGLHLNPLGEGAAGLGVRTAYDFPLKNSLIISPEVEFNYFPQNPSGNFGESQLLAGVKVGVRRGKIGLFGNVRPGFVHIPGDGDFGARNNGAATNLALDTGVVMEYWPRQRVALRFDIGDTMVRFPPGVNTGVGAPGPASMSHNLQFGMGVVFHF
jgi:hypothetical protein